ncbi:protein PUTATIVE RECOMBINATION INITIATION DEFECT 1-like isoform X2 [Telopea speciosissima]|uniref:protein PUTATIVE RECOMBINATION INITIATION DEFECT 1-like isoform X2 n=1 Tax=Telopea speciosissima TaxID=54955 RepID=UPI001CC4E705|nr:protein PUTATIVE RECOMBINATION INITIATION DEFECT 1-like isoform X2 [Telopea speciosissima]
MFFGEDEFLQNPPYKNSYPYTYPEDPSASSSSSCAQGHRSSLSLKTSEGGSICLVCFCNLISNPTSPSVHVIYALSQLSHAISQPAFLRNLRTFHAHLLICPLVQGLSSFDDEAIARYTTDLVSNLCDSDDPSLSCDFVVQIADRLSSAALVWSRRQVYPLHCLGVLLNRRADNPSSPIKNRRAFIANLVAGLQLPSEEIRGEILYVLYKLSILQDACGDGDKGDDDLLAFCPKLLYLSLEALMKTQSDEVRLNCVALLTVLAQRGYFENLFVDDPIGKSSREADMQGTELDTTPLIILFAEAVKGPLLSSDAQVQIGTLDLIFSCMSWVGNPTKQIQDLVEESIADYVFEILRLSGENDPMVNSCLRVLGLLSIAEQAFRQRLAVGFPTLVPVLRYVAEVPFHPVQSHVLKLVWSCISDCPGIVSRSQLEELMGMLPETFSIACSIFVALLKSPSSHGIPTLTTSVQESSRNAVLSCLCIPPKHPDQLLLSSLYLLKEAHAYSHEENSLNMEMGNCVIELCKTHLLPWFRRVIDEIEEADIILGVLETFHSILLQGSDFQARNFAEILASSSWFSLSFGCLGLFPTDKMKSRVYLLLSSVVDGLLGNDSGQPIRDAAPHMPLDPLDLLFLLGQKSSHDLDLISCQSAVLQILYTSSLYDERLADEKQVLASLEQYILVNSSNLLCRTTDSVILTQLVNLYGLFRGIAKMYYQIPYSPEAEKLLFHLIIEEEWDLLSLRIHPIALKWLFQQEKISGPMSNQVLNFCRSNGMNGNQIIGHGINTRLIDVKVIAELVAAEDNHGAALLVCLLKQLQEEEGQENEITLVMNCIIEILNICPASSDRLCLHGIGNAIHSLYYYSSYFASPQNFGTSALLIFNILRSVQSEILFDDEAWLPVAVKMLEFFIASMSADTCNHGRLLVIGILALILHHSTNHALPEASKAIILNTFLATTIHNIISAACSKGPALIDHETETSTGQTLIFVLLLYFFSLRSLHSLLSGAVEWQNFLEASDGTEQHPYICIRVHFLCRLVHFGSPPVKLVASHCLLELLTRISDDRHTKRDKLKCSTGYLKSVMAVLEGLIFYADTRIAMNCAVCLSMIMGWERLGVQETRVIKDDKWCRLVMEELALSLAAPGLASRSFSNHHRPAARIAIALLRLGQVPTWMRSVFDGSCISGIIEKLSASNVTAEMAHLFRELLHSGYLSEEDIAGLNRVFQACRKQVYIDSSQESNTEEHHEKVISIPDDIGKICELLINAMSSDSSLSIPSEGVHNDKNSLLEEIEMFSRESAER